MINLRKELTFYGVLVNQMPALQIRCMDIVFFGDKSKKGTDYYGGSWLLANQMPALQQSDVQTEVFL